MYCNKHLSNRKWEFSRPIVLFFFVSTRNEKKMVTTQHRKLHILFFFKKTDLDAFTI